MIYTLTLNPALDYVMNLSSFEKGEINRSHSEEIHYGGKGINVSVILRRLGESTKALGFASGFTGRKLTEMLRDDDIDCDFTETEKGFTRINVKLRSESETDINASGPPISECDINNLFLKLDEIKSGDLFVLAGSVPKSIPEDIYERILTHVRDRDIHFVIDAEKKLLLSTLRFRPFLIKPNHHELGELFGVKTETEEEIIKYSKELQSLGARNVLVSRAEKGALLLTENGEVFKEKNAPGRFIQSVGCGDSMVAGFISGYMRTNDYSYALKLATACGNATAYSPSLGESEMIERIMKEHFCEEIK